MAEPNLKKTKNWSQLAWLFPLMATVLIGSLLYFAQQSRHKRGDSDLARTLIRDRIDRAYSPLQLTAAHFGSISPGILVPQETVLRHFRFLLDTGEFTDLVLVSSRQQVSAFLGQEADFLAGTTRQRTPGATYLHLSTRAGQLDSLILGVPLTPTGTDPQWIVARYPISRLLVGLPTFLKVRALDEPEDPPVHPLAPRLSVGLSAHERPVWPLVLGEMMLFAGLLLLVLVPKRPAGQAPKAPQA
ncbi:hypothetical protein KJ975_07130 [Myxococcota bacterium]|nr:hypothetical protein [Myxococcota bacterium]